MTRHANVSVGARWSTGQTLTGLVGILITATLVGAAGSEALVAQAVLLLPVLLLIVCGWGGLRILMDRQEDVWTPLPWWLLTSGLYYGFGALAPALASYESIAYIWVHHWADDGAVLRTTQLNAAGLVAILVGYEISGKVGGLSRALTRFGPRPRSETFWIWVSVGLGVPILVFVTLPAAFGLILDFIPESVNTLGTLSMAALSLLAGRIAKGRIGLIPPFVALLGVTMAGALLSFSKLALVLPLVAVILGIYQARRKLGELGVGLLFLGVVYWLSIPLVDFGREAGRSVGSAGSRASAVGEFFEGGRLAHDDAAIQRWWTRLCYVPVQAFVMREYDSGRPGGTFDTLTYAFVPRLIWPGKPAVTQGDRLTVLINGSYTSMSSPTVVGECYWAGGWLLVAVGGLYIGLLFRFSRELIAPAMEAGNGGMVAFALMIVRIGLRPDDYFVGTFIASLSIVVFFLVFLRVVSAIPEGVIHRGALRAMP